MICKENLDIKKYQAKFDDARCGIAFADFEAFCVCVCHFDFWF